MVPGNNGAPGNNVAPPAPAAAAPLGIAEMIAITKIPDPIKAIPEYSGGTRNLHHWLTLVGDVLRVFENARNLNGPLYQMWIGVIRSKIIKGANDHLTARNVPNDWDRIREALIEIYADSRDLATLTQQIPYMKQNNKTLDEFYSEVADLTSDINQKLALDLRYRNHVDAVMTFVREMTKNAFIDGLKPPYNLTVRSAHPATIEVAKAAALDQLQSMQRNKFFSQNSASLPSNNKTAQSGNQKNSQRAPAQSKSQNRSRYESSNQAQNFRTFPNQSVPQNKSFNEQTRQANYVQNFPGNFQTPVVNPQNSFGSSQSVVPMDIDPSTRSRNFSQRARFNQVANVEQEELVEEVAPEPQDEAEELFDEANFLMATLTKPTG